MLVRHTFIEMILWGIGAACLGLAVNLVHPHQIPYLKAKPPVEVRLPEDVRIDEIEVIQANDLWDLGEYLFVDSRSPVQFEEGHIAGAVNLPWEEFEQYFPQVRTALGSKPGLVIYCAGEDCDLSHALARRLYQEGFRSIFVFFGGWHAWEAAGLPTETGR